MESLEQAIFDAFDKAKDKPVIKHLNGRQIIDYQEALRSCYCTHP
jgi:hypothetical protein